MDTINLCRFIRINKVNSGIQLYLSADRIPPNIINYVRIGNRNSDQDLNAYDWIRRLFGTSEREIINRMKNVPFPLTYSVGDINTAFNDIVGKYRKHVNDQIIVIARGINVVKLHTLAIGTNCVLQIASQFDFQESVDDNDAPVSSYRFDMTQGPQASIQATAAALHRKAAKHTGELKHALIDLLNIPMSNNMMLMDKYPRVYRNGYLQLGMVNNQDDKEAIFIHILSNIDKLRILPQWAMCESSLAMQLQVFCAAPSFQDTIIKPTPIDDNICLCLMVAQYRAIAQVAVILSRIRGRAVPLHLTLVGQGAFKNSRHIIGAMIDNVAEVTNGENVQVYVHAFNEQTENVIRANLTQGYEKKYTVDTRTLT